MKPDVSIIVPVYNAEKSIEQCLHSILAQTLESIEIILVDDGSTDSSFELCKTFLNDKRVHLFQKANGGVSSARNYGLKNAVGTYIAFVDSDDWIEPQMYQLMYQTACKHNADAVCCNFQKEGNKFIRQLPISEGYYDNEAFSMNILPRQMAYIDDSDGSIKSLYGTVWTYLFKKEIIDKYNIRFEECFSNGEDKLFTFSFLFQAQSFYYINRPLYHYAYTAKSLSAKYAEDYWSKRKALISRVEKILLKYDNDIAMRQFPLYVCSATIAAIQNELKLLSSKKRKYLLQNIRNIVRDPICDIFIDHIPQNSLNGDIVFYYNCIRKKSALRIVWRRQHKMIAQRVKRHLKIKQ